MRRSRLPLPKPYSLVQKHLNDSTPARLGQRGRPRTYRDAGILTLWLDPTLWQAAYREGLEEARQAGFPTPAWSTYHDRVRPLPLELFQHVLAQVGKVLARHLLLVNGTGLGFQDSYALSWRRGEIRRQVRTPGRRVIPARLDKQGRGFLPGAAVGPPYASEIRLLREIPDHLDALPPLPVVGDRGLDAVDLPERLEPFGTRPALRMKSSWPYTLRNPLRQVSQKKGERRGKYRYRVEGFFGLMKRKLGSAFPLVRQDVAMRRALWQDRNPGHPDLQTGVQTAPIRRRRRFRADRILHPFGADPAAKPGHPRHGGLLCLSPLAGRPSCVSSGCTFSCSP